MFLNSGPNVIGGGFNANNANTIAHNGGDGVAVVITTGPSIKKGIIRNSIYSNAGLGIDLGNNGVTPNDPSDGDTGPNTLQNYPVLTSVSTNGGQTTISGTLNSTPNTSFYLEFYSSQTADPTGFGEGQTYLGALSNVTTDGSGNATFMAILPVIPPAGHSVISATTTDNAELANTSEFSQAIHLSLQLSGRVFTPAGQALRNAIVRMTLSNGTVRTATTSSFGVYSFDNLSPGTSFILSVLSKRYRFAPKSIQLFDSAADVDFIGLE